LLGAARSPETGIIDRVPAARAFRPRTVRDRIEQRALRLTGRYGSHMHDVGNARRRSDEAEYTAAVRVSHASS
jgi:hypothetical protein